MKLCKDCKHVRHVRHLAPVSFQIVDYYCIASPSPIDGEPRACSLVRSGVGECGTEGKLWEAATAEAAAA